MDRSAGAVAAILAILRTGSSYVPLDPSLPADRLAFMANDSAISILVAGPGQDLAWLRQPTPVVHVEPLLVHEPAPVPGVPGTHRTLREVRTRISSEAEAYVIYTSGSTGRPKGCSVSHGNVVALLEAAIPLFDVTANDRWLLFHSYSFDFSVWELWGALATGAACVVADGDLVRDPERLVELCRTSEVSVLCCVPSVFSGLATRLHRCTGLRYVIFGGETLRPADVRAAAKLWDDAARPRFVNMYGITETTVHVTFKELDQNDLDSSGPLSPIGFELPHLRVVIADKEGRPVPDGSDGEMFVAGAGVARGYVGRDELTAQRFLELQGVRTYRTGDRGRRLPNGELAYRGRLDDQVKLRGFRIELGEVDSTLREHELVRESCTVLVGAAPGPVTLEAAVVIDAGTSTAELREFAATRLPAHMVPTRVVAVDALPRLGSGKPDRAAVTELLRRTGNGSDVDTPTGSSTAVEEPSLPSLQGLEELAEQARQDLVATFLTAAWTTALGHRDFGPDDGFFDVGGDSISIVSVHEMLAASLPHIEVRIVDLFLYPSVQALATHVAGLARPRRSASS
jgi:amino acid adenylation domain-containing protein